MRLVLAAAAAGLVLGALAGGALVRPAPGVPSACRPSDPARAVRQADGAVPILYLGNSLVFDHDWRVRGALAVNCARQGTRAAEVDVAALPDADPRLVVLGFGTIEVLRAVPAAQAAEDIGRLSRRLAERFPQARLLLLAVPETEGVDRAAVRALNDRLARMAQETGVVVLPLTLGDGDSYDGVHLRPSAYGDWEDAIAAEMRR